MTDKSYAIYTRSDSNYFPGLVALLNSLRSQGDTAPVYLVDTGLTVAQLNFLQSRYHSIYVWGVSAQAYHLDSSKRSRYNGTVFAGLEVSLPGHYDVLVHLDADAIALRPLDDLVEAAYAHGFAATGEIPPSNMRTHFWGMPEATGRALKDIGRAEQEDVYEKMTQRFGLLDEDAITFNSGIWATRTDYWQNAVVPTLNWLKQHHRAIWGLEQAMLNIAAFYANRAEPFREVGARYNSRAEYTYFNGHYAESGYRIAAPRVVDEPVHNKGQYRLNGVGGDIAILHYVWKPKPWESNDVALAEVWRHFSDMTPNWHAGASSIGLRGKTLQPASSSGWSPIGE